MRLKSAAAPSTRPGSVATALPPPAPSRSAAPRSASPSPRSAAHRDSRKPVARDSDPPRPEHKILFQKFFKSVGPRTYAAQIKEAGNGNHFIVLTEGRRDDSGEVRKTRLFVFGEDFREFFRMLHEVAVFVRDHPIPDEVKQRRRRFWNRKNGDAKDK